MFLRTFGSRRPPTFLQSLWRLPSKILSCKSGPKPLDHGLNDNFIGKCGCLCSQAQKPSNIRLKVFFMVLCTLKQSLSCDWLRLKALEASDQHVLELLPRCNCPWPERRVPSLGHISDCHDEGLCHDGSITPIRRYCCFKTHQELLRIQAPIIHRQLRWLVGLWPWNSLQFCYQRRSIIKGKATMMEVVIPFILVK
jgi:hypothetical protein